MPLRSKSSSHKRLLTRLVIVFHAVIAVVIILLGKLPAFDASALAVLNTDSTWAEALLRWDVFHFTHIAQEGYVYEHEYAFFPGTPFIMRYGAKILGYLGLLRDDGVTQILVAGAAASAIIAVDTVQTLYNLTLVHFPQSENMALLVSLLSLLSSSPATLRFAPYTESFSTYFSYKGMLFCAQGRLVLASLTFMIAGLFRSNAAMLIIHVVWPTIIQPVLDDHLLEKRMRALPQKFLYAILLSIPPLIPFAWHQYNGFHSFCQASQFKERRPWCFNRVPLIYSFVQSEYWNVGLFRYWTIQQLPNILIATPVLVLLFHASVYHIAYSLIPRINFWLKELASITTTRRAIGDQSSIQKEHSTKDLILNPSLSPHAVQTFTLSLMLLISAHTQIALRLVCALPFTYWAAARLLLSEPVDLRDDNAKRSDNITELIGAARWWITWSVVWGTVSLVTWAVFLPPA